MIGTGAVWDGQDVGRRAAAGGAWLLGARLAQQGVTLVQVAVLARLLDPQAFGLVALADLAAQAIGVFVYTGYEFALVQKPDLQEIDVHTAWWVMLGRYLVIGACLMLLAGPIARFYHAPEAAPVLVAIGAIQVIQGLASPSPILLRRGMRFRSLFRLDVGSATAGLAVGVVTAFALRTVWALVLARLATTVTLIVLSYRLDPYRPRRRFSRQSFRQLSAYGKWVLGAAILSFVFSQGSSALSGVMFGVAALGLYQMAARFGLLASTQFSEVLQGALMPAYSLMQADKARVSAAFVSAISLAAMLLVGVTALIAFGLPRVLTSVLGEQWSQAAALVPVIAAAGGVQSMLRTGAPLFLGTGQPQALFLVDLIQAVTMVLLLYPLGHLLGLPGLPCAMLGGGLCALPAWWHGVRHTTSCTLRQVGTALAPPLLGAAIVAVVFGVGRMAPVSRVGSGAEMAWHLALIVVAGVGYISVIGLCQGRISHYAPLMGLRNAFGAMLRHGTSTEPATTEWSAAEPLVSICIPAYNAERFIEETIASALAQTYHNVEIIVSDDASTDRTAEVVERYRPQGVRLIRQPRNLGRYANMNAVIRASAGAYILKLDADDVLEPEHVAAQIAVMEAYPEVVFSHCACRLINVDGRPVGCERTVHRSFIRSGMEEWPRYVFGPRAVNVVTLRRSAYDAVGGYDERYRYSGDWAMHRSLLRVGSVFYNARVLASYRVHSIGKEGIRHLQAEEHLLHLGDIERDWPAAVPAKDRLLRQARKYWAFQTLLGAAQSQGHERGAIIELVPRYSPSWSVRLVANVTMHGGAGIVRVFAQARQRLRLMVKDGIFWLLGLIRYPISGAPEIR